MAQIIGFVPWVVAIATAAALVLRQFVVTRTLSERTIALICFSFLPTYAAALTVLQGYVWTQTPFTKVLLTLPLEKEVPLGMFELFRPLFENPGGYFAFYTLGRFWLPIVFVLVCALIIGLLALLAHRKRPMSMSRTDMWCIVAAALIAGTVGWPYIILFVPILLLVSAGYAVVQTIRKKEAHIGNAVIVALLLSLFLGSSFTHWISL